MEANEQEQKLWIQQDIRTNAHDADYQIKSFNIETTRAIIDTAESCISYGYIALKSVSNQSQ